MYTDAQDASNHLFMIVYMYVLASAFMCVNIHINNHRYEHTSATAPDAHETTINE